MFLTFLSRLMASLLTTLLFTMVVGLSANQTILNTGYIKDQLQEQKAYDRLSTGLSDKISESSGSDAGPAVSQAELAAQLKTILTPEVLKAKIDTTLQQLDAYYRGDGPVPTLDISDIVAQANKAGLEINDPKFSQPITLTATTKAKKVSDAAKLISIGVVVLAGLLALGVLAIAIKRKDYRPVANIVFSLGLMLTITGGALLLVPRVFEKLHQFTDKDSPFVLLGRDLAVSMIHDFGLRLLIPGVVLLLIGIGLKVLFRRLRKAAKHNHPAHHDAETPAVPVDPANLQPAHPVAPTDVPAVPTATPPVPRATQPRPGRKIQL